MTPYSTDTGRVYEILTFGNLGLHIFEPCLGARETGACPWYPGDSDAPNSLKLARGVTAVLAGASTSVKADAKCTRCLGLHFWI